MTPGSALKFFSLRRALPLAGGLIFCAGLLLPYADASLETSWTRVLIAWLVFLLPGGCLFACLPAREDWDLIDFIGYGFSFSMALVTLLGFIARTLHLTIDMVELVWHGLAALGLAGMVYRSRTWTGDRLSVDLPILALLAIILIQVALYAHASVLAAPMTDDQNRHHAAVSGFLRAEPLGWSEPYYETGNLIADRMVLTYWVLAQALIVKLSGVPIILARYLINPLVMVMAVAAMVVFARDLRHSRKSSLMLVCLGLLALSLVAGNGPQPGSQFFARALLDKVVAGFALAPLAISSAFLCLTSDSRRATLAFGLAFLAASFVHAILGAFAACVIASFCLISWVSDGASRRRVLMTLLLMLLLLCPAILARLTTAESTIYNFETALANSGSPAVHESDMPPAPGSFYAIDPSVAGPLTYILILLTPLAVMARSLDARGRLMLAYVLAVGIGLLPFTADIYGRLVSFDHVERVLWLMPYGYMLGFALDAAYGLAGRWLPGWLLTERVMIALLALAPLVTGHFLGFNRRVDFSRDIAHAISGDRELLEIGAYIDARHDDRVWVAASPETRGRAIMLSWKIIELSRFTAERMAYYSKLPLAQAEMQLEDNLRLYESAVPVEEKLAIIDRYGIDYLLFPKGYAWMVDALYQRDKERFELVYSGDNLRLVRAHGSEAWQDA